MNLAGLYEHPQHWRYPQHHIAWSTPLALTDLAWERDGDEVVVRWSAAGPWHHLPDATVTVRAERWQGEVRNGPPRILAAGVPVDAGVVRAVLSAPPDGMRWRMTVIQDGDPLLGNRSR
jgi:hypothetical protein